MSTVFHIWVWVGLVMTVFILGACFLAGRAEANMPKPPGPRIRSTVRPRTRGRWPVHHHASQLEQSPNNDNNNEQ